MAALSLGFCRISAGIWLAGAEKVEDLEGPALDPTKRRFGLLAVADLGAEDAILELLFTSSSLSFAARLEWE